MSKDSTKIIGIILGVFIGIVGAFLYFDPKMQNYYAQVENLSENNAKYSEKYSKLKQTHDVLQTKYDELNYQYSYLQASYVNLDYLYTINKELRIGNSLTSYYDYLRYEFGPMGSRSTWLNDEESCKFACQLALHDLHKLYWVKAEEYYGEDVGQNSYKQAWEVLRTAVNFCNIETSNSDTEKIEKILDFINGLIIYESEIDDSLRAPVETLSLRSGDCDDFSILAAAMFEAVDIEASIGFFETKTNAHAMVLVRLKELDNYHYWYYDDLTRYDLQPGRWIIIEPQLKIDHQGIEELEKYDLYMAVELDYEKASSELIR